MDVHADAGHMRRTSEISRSQLHSTCERERLRERLRVPLHQPRLRQCRASSQRDRCRRPRQWGRNPGQQRMPGYPRGTWAHDQWCSAEGARAAKIEPAATDAEPTPAREDAGAAAAAADSVGAVASWAARQFGLSQSSISWK